MGSDDDDSVFDKSFRDSVGVPSSHDDTGAGVPHCSGYDALKQHATGVECGGVGVGQPIEPDYVDCQAFLITKTKLSTTKSHQVKFLLVSFICL